VRILAILKRHLRSATPVAVLLLLAGCTALRNTPQQDYVWEMGRICDGLDRNWYLDKVEPDGRYTVRGTANAIPSPALPYFACMKGQFTARPYGEWLRRRSATAPPVLAPSSKTPADSATPPIPRPTWVIGDEWSYRWESPTGKGTFTWVVDRFERMDGVDTVVVKSGSREIFYRREDGAHILDRVDGAVEIRSVPPIVLIQFPLLAVKKWPLEYTREQPLARQTDDMLLDCRSDPTEAMSVPAGTFRAVHVACFNRLGGALGFEVWYAPVVGNVIKDRTVLSYGIRLRELVGFKHAPRDADTLELDIPAPAYGEYFGIIRERIRATWIYPPAAGKAGVEGVVGLVIEIAKDGTLLDVRLKTPSGSEVLDQAALAAVRASAPFPPVPDGVAKRVLLINGSFKYQIAGPDVGTKP
jgi:TonB family protein